MPSYWENRVWVASSMAKVLKPNAIALGNFDGIHRGHLQVLKPILQHCNPPINVGESLDLGEKKKATNTHATLVTFNPHPREFFTGEQIQLLTTLWEKIQQLEKLGIQQLVLLPFDRFLAQLSPEEFVKKILVEQLEVSLISVGEDFRFGYQRSGTAEDLKAIAAQFNVEVFMTSLETSVNSEQNLRISSSAIRTALERGEVKLANQLLGRAYSLTGTVVEGARLGRTIGFPTANLQLPADKFLPGLGVYWVRVTVATQSEDNVSNTVSLSQPTWGVMNIGCRPTVDGKTTTVEVHLLDWSGNLYGQTITVSLEQFLRSEQKFSSLEALKAQITQDCDLARELIKSQNKAIE